MEKIYREQRSRGGGEGGGQRRRLEQTVGRGTEGEIMGTSLLQPHHKQISRSSSQAINIQGISFLFKKRGRGDLDPPPPCFFAA